jgi:hypothetical protein
LRLRQRTSPPSCWAPMSPHSSRDSTDRKREQRPVLPYLPAGDDFVYPRIKRSAMLSLEPNAFV